ncbi:Zinc transporter ZIP9 [Candida viswanathii]|uniref:Zinc transporter ZIP9 n=1 Tax=Candida viswanathii TaxID=5486 RepID=A0A367XLN4_9ASCO|nr:Zinc transporter ZIP9 [Candida viswanathii]
MSFSRVIELIILTVVMFLTSFVAGILPLKLTISLQYLKYLSLLAMGILVGTAMLIILPEGIEILSSSTQNISGYVGFPILVGFLTMFTIDNVSSGHNNSNSNKNHTSLKDSIFGSSLTLGMVFHGIVDGISLGSSFAGGTAIPLLIFTAIIIHKIPTSFSLSTILCLEGVPDSKLFWHILLFASLSPVATWITYVIVSLLDNNMDVVVGILFLFSAGNFLYVVSHVMSEFTTGDFEVLPTSVESEANTVVTNPPHSRISKLEFALALAGILVPALLSFIKE